MPWFVPLALPLLGVAAAGTTIGLQASGAFQPSSGDATKQLQQAQQQQAQQDALARQKAIQANLANAQEQGGGALGPTSLVDLASVIAGVPGESNTNVGRAALGAYLGTPGATTTTGTLPSGDTMMGLTAGLSGAQQG